MVESIQVGSRWGMSEMLRRALEARIDGEVRFDAGSRAVYAHDSSNYRQPPIGVVVPRTVESGAELVEVCREHDVPVFSRGGGTSLAGQCCNEGVVIDWSKYCNRLIEVDVAARRAVVEPGACLDDLNAELKRHGLMVGPKPSTHDTCTIGGMIGNNSCGASAEAYGKMVDSVIRLEVLTYDGARMWVGETSDEDYEQILKAGGRRAEIYRRLREPRDENLALLRTQEEADARAHAARAGAGVTVSYLDDPAEEERLWRLREAGLGATAYPPGHPDTHEGWEDAAVPPERLGNYLRDFRRLLEEFGYGSASLYGHFGQGCVHTRIGFDLSDTDGAATYRGFVERAARLVATYGGSLSGEHGDGSRAPSFCRSCSGRRRCGCSPATSRSSTPATG